MDKVHLPPLKVCD